MFCILFRPSVAWNTTINYELSKRNIQLRIFLLTYQTEYIHKGVKIFTNDEQFEVRTEEIEIYINSHGDNDIELQ